MDQLRPPSAALASAWAMPIAEAAPAPIAGRCSAAFEVRESNEHNRTLFDAMRSLTYQPFRSNPWIAAVLREGMAPMDALGTHVFRVELQGEVLELEVLIERIVKGRTAVVRFQVGPYLHIWSMSSAATANEQGDNDFTQALVELVREVRPQVLVAANIGRLVRSSQESGLLQKVLPDHVDEVWAGSARMVLRGPDSAMGRLQFATLGMVASLERDWIVTRLMTGRIAAWHRGEWLMGSHSVPFGYRLENRVLVPVPELAERVHRMLLILGDAEAPPSLTARRLVAEKLPMRRLSDERPLGDSATPWANPRGTVDGFLSWVPLWVAGEYLWRFGCPLKDADEIAGVPVVRPKGLVEGPGELQLLLTPGVPEGGWAPREVLDRVALVAMQRAAEKASAGLAAPEIELGAGVVAASAAPDLHQGILGPSNNYRRDHRPRRRGNAKVSAFSGYSWAVGDAQFELRVANARHYDVVRRPLTSEVDQVAGGGRDV